MNAWWSARDKYTRLLIVVGAVSALSSITYLPYMASVRSDHRDLFMWELQYVAGMALGIFVSWSWLVTPNWNRFPYVRDLDTRSIPAIRRVMALAFITCSIGIFVGPFWLYVGGELRLRLFRWGTTFYLDQLLLLALIAGVILILRMLVRSENAKHRSAAPVLVGSNDVEHELNTMAQRISEVTEDLTSTQNKINSTMIYLGEGTLYLESALAARTAKLEELAAKAKQYEETAALHKNASEAVRQFLTEGINHKIEAVNRSTTRAQWRFFLAGLLASVPVGFLINMLTKD